MGSLSGLIDLARNTLSADQAALSATANNVANQNTVGYTREVVSFTAGDSVTLNGNNTTADQAPTVTVTSQRDRVLEQRIQQQTQGQSETSALTSVYAQVESIFSLSSSSTTSGSTQVGTALNDFFSSLTALASNPSDSSTRQAVLTAAGTLASAFNSAGTQLASVSSGLNSDAATTVGEVNALTTTIAKLNGEIAATGKTTDAGTLEDARQSAIAQLSHYVGLNQITTDGNGISLTTTGGAVLVSGAQAYALSASTVGGVAQVEDATGTNVTAGITGGSLGGDIAAQTTELPAVQTALDALAYRVATAVNTQNEAGLDASGAAAGAIFSVGTSATGAATAITVSATSGSALAAAGTGEGTIGATNANALAELENDTTGGQTMSEQLAAMLGAVGTRSSQLSDESTTQTASLTQLTTERDSLSSVSLDDEAANLSQYQRAYEAASKLFTILDSLMTSALNLGTETAVS